MMDLGDRNLGMSKKQSKPENKMQIEACNEVN
jgi:hypothetical protein